MRNIKLLSEINFYISKRVEDFVQSDAEDVNTTARKNNEKYKMKYNGSLNSPGFDFVFWIEHEYRASKNKAS